MKKYNYNRYKNRPTVYHSIPFNTVQYRSVPFNTIEDINGKFVGLNGTLNGKKGNERYTIEHLKYRSVPFNDRSVPFSVILRMSTVNVLVSMVN